MKFNHKILLSLCLLVFYSAARSQTGTISGFVMNGSADSSIVPDIEVNLLVYKGEHIIDDSSYQNKSNASGKYSFSALPIDTTLIFYPRATFSSVVYYGHAVRLTEKWNNIKSNVVVFDTTSAADQIALQLEHLFIDAEPGKLFFREIFIIANAGTKTFIGKNFDQHGKQVVLEFPLPGGFENLEILTPEAENSVYVRDLSLNYIDLLSPGTRQFSFRFEVPNKKKEWQMSRPILYPLGAANIFVSNPDLVIEGPGVAAMGNFPIRGNNYQRYAVTHLMPGMTLNLTVKNLPGKSFSFRWLVLIGVVVLLLIGFAYTLRKSKS